MLVHKNDKVNISIESYSTTWKANGGRLEVADDNKTSIWFAEGVNHNNLFKIIVEISVKNNDGNEIKFEKSIEIKVKKKSSSSSDRGSDSEDSKLDEEILNEQLLGLFQKELKANEDYDNDGLITSEEKNIGTDPVLMDTDYDGLYDGFEVNTSKTNPLKRDTDNDGVSDGIEWYLGLDPFSIDSDSDGIKDSESQYNFVTTNEEAGVCASVYGSHDIVSNTFIDIYDNEFINNGYGVVGKTVDVTSSPNITSAQLKFTYSDDELTSEGLNEESLSIYYLNEELLSLERVESVTDTVYNSVYANVTHFSKYLLADSSKINTDINEVDIVFVLDNSGSMRENDPEDKRLEAAQNVVSSLDGEYNFGEVRFDDGQKTLKSLTKDKESAQNAIESLRNTAWGGTRIGSAINHAIDEFVNEDSRKVMILLTDGLDHDNISYTQSAVQKANDKHIQIYTIGLGKDVNNEFLENTIAKPTGGKYFFANDADKLLAIFGNTSSNLNLNKVKVEIKIGNTTKVIEGEELANSGFDPKVNGFSFSNLSSTLQDGGVCQGFAAISNMYYNDELPYSKGKQSDDFPGYNLSDIEHFKKEDNLFKYNIEYLERQWKKEQYNKQEYNTNKNLYYFPDDVRKDIINKGFEIKTENGNEYDFEYFVVDMNSGAWSDENKQVLNAIHWWWKDQTSSNKRDFKIEDIKEEMNKQRSSLLQFGGSHGFFEYTGHAVTGIQLIKDSKEENVYWIVIYDNNYPGDLRGIKVEKKKKLFNITGPDYYYKIDALDYDKWDKEINIYLAP